MDAINNPEDESKGNTKVPFTRELLLKGKDFRKILRRNFQTFSANRG
jgi:hypothetical protein